MALCTFTFCSFASINSIEIIFNSNASILLEIFFLLLFYPFHFVYLCFDCSMEISKLLKTFCIW